MGNRPTSDAGRFRSVPERSPDFAHLSLGGLRAYRHTLSAEESRVSYWRRIVQARLDLVRAADAGTVTTVDNLRGVFAEARVDSGRTALMTVLPLNDIPPLPDLAGIWAREMRAAPDASRPDRVATAGSHGRNAARGRYWRRRPLRAGWLTRRSAARQ